MQKCFVLLPEKKTFCFCSREKSIYELLALYSMFVCLFVLLISDDYEAHIHRYKYRAMLDKGSAVSTEAIRSCDCFYFVLQ